VPPAFGNAALAVVCAADAADEAEETPVSTYPFVAASAVLFGAASYDLTKVNIILFWWMGGTSVGYVITPAV